MNHNSEHYSQETFKGLRVAITGGTSGLGLALVRELTGRGARVAFVARGSRRRSVPTRASGNGSTVADRSDWQADLGHP